MPIAPIDWLSNFPHSRIIRDLCQEDDGLRRAAFREYREFIDRYVQLPPGDASMDPEMLITASLAVESMISGKMKPGFQAVTEGTNVALTVGAFLRDGRQSFRFDEALSEELALTDVDDVSLSEISTPYDAFFLEFASNSTLTDGTLIEGMLVQRRTGGPEDVLYMTPFVRTDDGTDALSSTYIPLGSPDADETVGTALGRVRERLENDPEGKDSVALTHPGGITAEAMHQQDPSVGRANIKKMSQGLLIVEELLPLIINGLLYIDNCTSGLRSTWDPNAPDHLAAKANADRAGARKARRELTRMGWTRITLCTLEDDAEPTEGSPRGERTVSAHWRRGHWRRQHYGPRNSLIRRVRIRPVRVKGREGNTRPGYNVVSS